MTNQQETNLYQTMNNSDNSIKMEYIDKVEDVLNLTDPNDMDAKIFKNTINITKILKTFYRKLCDNFHISKEETEILIYCLKFIDTLNLFMSNQTIDSLTNIIYDINELILMINNLEDKDNILKKIRYTEMTVIYYRKKHFKNLFFGSGAVLGNEIEKCLEQVNINGTFDQKLFKQMQNIFYVVQSKIEEKYRKEIQITLNELKAQSVKNKKGKYNYYDDYDDYADYKNYSHAEVNYYDYYENFNNNFNDKNNYTNTIRSTDYHANQSTKSNYMNYNNDFSQNFYSDYNNYNSAPSKYQSNTHNSKYVNRNSYHNSSNNFNKNYYNESNNFSSPTNFSNNHHKASINNDSNREPSSTTKYKETNFETKENNLKQEEIQTTSNNYKSSTCIPVENNNNNNNINKPLDNSEVNLNSTMKIKDDVEIISTVIKTNNQKNSQNYYNDNFYKNYKYYSDKNTTTLSHNIVNNNINNNSNNIKQDNSQTTNLATPIKKNKNKYKKNKSNALTEEDSKANPEVKRKTSANLMTIDNRTTSKLLGNDKHNNTSNNNTNQDSSHNSASNNLLNEKPTETLQKEEISNKSTTNYIEPPEIINVPLKKNKGIYNTNPNNYYKNTANHNRYTNYQNNYGNFSYNNYFNGRRDSNYFYNYKDQSTSQHGNSLTPTNINPGTVQGNLKNIQPPITPQNSANNPNTSNPYNYNYYSNKTGKSYKNEGELGHNKTYKAQTNIISSNTNNNTNFKNSHNNNNNINQANRSNSNPYTSTTYKNRYKQQLKYEFIDFEEVLKKQSNTEKIDESNPVANEDNNINSNNNIKNTTPNSLNAPSQVEKSEISLIQYNSSTFPADNKKELVEIDIEKMFSHDVEHEKKHKSNQKTQEEINIEGDQEDPKQHDELSNNDEDLVEDVEEELEEEIEDNEDEDEESENSVDNELIEAEFNKFIRESNMVMNSEADNEDNYYLDIEDNTKNNKIIFEDDNNSNYEKTPSQNVSEKMNLKDNLIVSKEEGVAPDTNLEGNIPSSETQNNNTVPSINNENNDLRMKEATRGYIDSLKNIDPKRLLEIKSKLNEEGKKIEIENTQNLQNSQNLQNVQPGLNGSQNIQTNQPYEEVVYNAQRQYAINNKVSIQNYLFSNYAHFFYRGRDSNIHREYFALKCLEQENSTIVTKNIETFENKILIPIYQKINFNVNKKKGIYFYTFTKYKKLIYRVLEKDKILKKVKPYGSFMNNFLIDSGDIDICIVPKCNILEFSSYLDKIKEEIVLQNIAEHKLTHHTSRYMLLKVVDLQTRFVIDITVHTMLPILNTNLIRLYSLYDQRFHILGLYIKHWGKINKIHGAADNYLSSYALLLMLISFLQNVIEPRVLPNLQKVENKEIPYEYTQNGEIISTNIYYEEDIQKIKAYMNTLNKGRENRDSAAQLLIKFFEYYSYYFDYYDQRISIHKDIKDSFKKSQDNIAFSIEDPFDQYHNPGKSMTINSNQFNKFITAMKKEINFILNGEYVKRFEKIS